MSWCICREGQADTFRSALNDLRKREIDTDIIIVCGQKEFKAHKNILGSSCAYFHNMLYGNFAESNNQRIEMPKIKENIMAEILDFIYTIAHPKLTDKSFEMVANTFRAAHFLMMEHLSNYIWMELKRRLEIDNCLILLNMMSLYDMDGQEILMFAASHFSDILRDKRFKEIDENQLHMLLSNKNVNPKMSSDMLLEIVLDWVKLDEEQRKKNLIYLLTAIDLHSLTPDFKKKIISKERLLYSEPDIMVKLVEATCDIKPIDLTDKDFISCVDFYFFDDLYTYNGEEDKYAGSDAMQIFYRGQKQEAVKLPFMINEGVACVLWQNYIAFIGGGPDGEDTSNFLLYNPENNVAFYETCLPHPVSHSKICVVNQTLYVSSELEENGTTRHIIQCYDKTGVWRVVEMQEIESILAIVSMKDMLHVLSCKKKGEYYLHYINKQNELLLFHRLPFALEIYNNYYIAAVDNKLCFFVFEKHLPKLCIIYDGCMWKTVIMSMKCKCRFFENVYILPCESLKKIFFLKEDAFDHFHIFDPLTPTLLTESAFVSSYDLGRRSVNPNNEEQHDKRFYQVLVR